MAAMTGNTRNPASEISLAPMIEVLPVLLLIFMAIVPVIPRGEGALAPRTSPEKAVSRWSKNTSSSGATGVQFGHPGSVPPARYRMHDFQGAQSRRTI